MTLTCRVVFNLLPLADLRPWELRQAEIESGGEIAERVTPRQSAA